MTQIQYPATHAPDHSGKVRDIFDLGDKLLLVASDRLSAYDVVLPDQIPDKGAILTSITRFWMDQFGDRIPHHLLSVAASDLPEPFAECAQHWGPRFMLVRKLEMFPIECIVRGYITGSGWKEYQQHGTVCGIELPAGLRDCEQLPEPIFTPSTKNDHGHDENISLERAAELVGAERLAELQQRSLEIYSFGRDYARERGIILADTKFEFGCIDGGPAILGDEVLTPDSSRFWPADEYTVGEQPPSFDKQYVRNHLSGTDWDKKPPAPTLPEDVIAGTCARYQEIYQKLTGQPWSANA
ncbi:MAG: phosphoribosylaminoimidazolesuccinocarboxamide synthase [Planctomycetota bacterium]